MVRVRRLLLGIVSLFLTTALLTAGSGPAHAATLGSVSGSLVDQSTGLPVANARVRLFQGAAHIADAVSDGNGAFRFGSEPPGIYFLEISATGYELGRSEDVAVVAGDDTNIHATLVRSRTAQTGSLREIASVRATRSLLQTSSVFTEHITGLSIQREGLLRVSDALLSLPGITSNDLDSAPGDDLHISIRGLKGSETSTLIDGFPVGPLGISAGAVGGYNYQLSPAFALSNVQVAYGTGGLALYGVDTVAGAIDLQTLEPTRAPLMTLQQGFGTQGRSQTVLTGTGTTGRLGYALSLAAQGTYGNFKPQTFTQTGLLAGDISPGNVAANTYPVSGNYLLRQNLLKLRFAVNPTSSLTLTGYDAASWDDKSGEGDNDFLSPEYVGALFDGSIAPGTNCISVTVDDAGTQQCYNRQQYVSAFSGPAGGGGTAWQALRNQHYSLKFNSAKPHNNFATSVFYDSFNTLYDRFLSGFVNNYQTVGEQISDDIISEKNDFGFGVYAYNQAELDHNFNPSKVTFQPTLDTAALNYFVRDTYQPNSQFSAFATGWIKQNSVTNRTSFDPRLTLVFRPSRRDVVRISGGHAEGVPQLGLLKSPVQFNQTPTNLNPVCGGLTSVARASNKNLSAEKANDLEISVGHNFSRDTSLQAIAFDMNETDVLFGAVVPLSALGLAPDPNLLAQYLSRVGQFCNSSPTINSLGATTVANAGAGRYRGIDFTGRFRASDRVFFDYSYNILSARLFGIPDLALRNNLTLVDGGQIDRVPIHTASLGLDVSDAHGLEVRFDGYYVGRNNGLLRPAYTYANAAITKQVRNLTFNVGVYNLFNSQYDQFGRIGLATFQPENQYGTDANGLQQALTGADGERFGLPQRSILFSITTHI